MVPDTLQPGSSKSHCLNTIFAGVDRPYNICKMLCHERMAGVSLFIPNLTRWTWLGPSIRMFLALMQESFTYI